MISVSVLSNPAWPVNLKYKKIKQWHADECEVICTTHRETLASELMPGSSSMIASFKWSSSKRCIAVVDTACMYV